MTHEVVVNVCYDWSGLETRPSEQGKGGLSMEIERQFLVDAIPVLPREYDMILQGYVSTLPEIRIRQVRTPDNRERYFLTVKRGAGLSREEWETQITSTEFSHLIERLEPDTEFIEKRRYRLPLCDGHTAEFHRHEAALKGFNYVEVEFSSEEEARAFDPPAWFGREVTEDPRFTYSRLARVDGPELAQKILAMPPEKPPEELLEEAPETLGMLSVAETTEAAEPEPDESPEQPERTEHTEHKERLEEEFEHPLDGPER